MQYSIPEVGKNVVVLTDLVSPGHYQGNKQRYCGTVVKPFKWTGTDDFCMTTDDQQFPIRVVDIKHVIDLKYIDGSTAEKHETTAVPKIQNWTVSGSKGDIYIVTCDGDKWACDCVAGRFGRDCKHVAKLKLECK